MPASASLSPFHKRGLAAERACADWLVRQGWVILEHRLKTPFAEIDLLASEPSKAAGNHAIWHAIEVKTITADAFFLNRVGFRQRGRLMRAREHLQERYSRLVGLDLMTVDESGRVEYFADFLS